MRYWLTRGLLTLLAALLGYQLWLFAHVLWWVDHNPDVTALMRERLQQMRQTNPHVQLVHQWVGYDHIAGSVKRAVIAGEDSNFLHHHGFDWDGIQLAARKDWQRGRIVAGGSTISQQLAKNLLLSEHRTPGRKLEEALVTLMLEKTMSKRRILEIYLNVIEWGNGVFGVAAASHHYFHLAPALLSNNDSARLAAMIPNPRYFDDHRNSRWLRHHTATIAARMALVSVPR